MEQMQEETHNINDVMAAYEYYYHDNGTSERKPVVGVLVEKKMNYDDWNPKTKYGVLWSDEDEPMYYESSDIVTYKKLLEDFLNEKQNKASEE